MADSKKTLEDLKKDIEAELKKQREARDEIKKAQVDLRELRQKKADLAAERAKNEESIRELKIELNEDKEIARDKTLPDEIRESAKERIDEHNIALRGVRKDISSQDAELARTNTKIQRSLGNREHKESLLSSSRTTQRETVGRMRMMEAVDSLTPQQLKNETMRGMAPDADLEGLKSRDSIRRMGGTRPEQQQAQQASQEFHGLFQTIKEARKSLAGLTEGTEEYKQKQAELTAAQSSAADALSKLEKIERDVEKRKLSAGTGAAGAASTGLGYVGGAMRFGAEGFDRLGGMATERYVLEEQRKQAQLGLQNMSLTDTRNRTRDATSFLSSGGGRLFGAEMPWDRKGKTSQGIQALGQDYADTREAVPQYKMMFNALGGAADVAAGAVGKGIEGAAINPLTGGFAAGGELIRGGSSLALNTLKEGMFTPEVAGRFGGEKLTSMARDFNETVGGAVGTGLKFTGGGAVEWGGGDRPKFEGGVDKITGAGTEMANALPKVMERAYESVEQMNQLISSEVQSAQAQRVRERLSMAFAPAVQQYMDVQGTQKSTLRSAAMNRAERETYENRLEQFSMDEELGDRGFGPEAILGATNQAARSFGRRGLGGLNERASKSALMAESMGLGDAGSNLQAMSKMLGAGVKDPEALFTKAVKEGLQKGLQDSRDFQGLLDAAVNSAESSVGFEGTLSNLLKLTGSGRAGDMKTAQAAYQGIQQDMSGFSGDWTDMVKMDITNKAAGSVIKTAGEKGIELDREDKTSLQLLGNLKPEELQNIDLVKSALTPKALEAVEASGGVEKYVQGLNTSMMAHGTTDRAINATQSKDLARVRNLLASGDAGKEELAKMFAGPEGEKKLEKLLALNMAGMSSTGSVDRALGATQGLANQIGEAVGMDPQKMRVYQEKYERKDAATVRAESGAANTMGEQMARGDAQIGQENMGTVRAVGRDAQGRNLLADEQSKTRDKFVDQQANMAKNIVDEKTASPELKVERLDKAIAQMVEGFKEIKDSLKDFSAKDMVVNATKDVVIQGASAIKGVMLDNALTQAATEAGTVIADKVRDAFSSDKGSSAPAPKASAPSKSVPTPQGT